ncbi:MAG: hypothetical protein COA41_12795 [Sphingopyxis sp.]|nr:MAG: hypothetical protein COA41_12795 [Sphingopyxis sp.]
MTEQQITEFDRWFEQRMDPELNLTPGDKELCRHAWKAALSHAEWEAQPDYVLDALDNLIHDNYERSYRGAKNRQDDAELIRCALRRSHPAPQVAVPEKVRELIGAVRSVNRSRQHSIHIEGDDEPCFWQRAEWVRYVLELADEAEQTITAAPTAPAGEPECGCCGRSDQCDTDCDAQQPVSDPDGLPDRVLMPRALTAENGAKTALSDEFFVDFGVRCARCGNPDFSLDLGQCAACQHTECEPNRRAVSWTTIKRIYSRAVEFLGVPAPDEREIAARALDDFMFDVAERVRLLSGSDQEARVLRKVNGWLHSRAKRLRAGKEGQ